MSEMSLSSSNGDSKVNNRLTFFLIIVYLAAFVLIIIWLFKILHKAKGEPKNRSKYITKDPSYYYEEGEFCYDNYEKYIRKGALNLFNLPIKKIKKYTIVLIITIFIAIGSIILSLILLCISSCQSCFPVQASFIFIVTYVLAFFLSIAFAIVLAHYLFKGNYRDFEEFSRCRYLSKGFREDYEYIYDIKDGFQFPFVIVLLIELLNFLKLLAEYDNKKR